MDTFFTKVVPLFFKLSGTADRDGQMKIVDDAIGHIEKEIEPSLADAMPFFVGSKTLTVVEVSYTVH